MRAIQRYGLNINANRTMKKWTRKELIGRVVWELISFLFFWPSPRPLWGWRRVLLRLFGARIGNNVHIFPSVKIAIPWNLEIGDYAAIGDGAILYNLGQISIGERSTISQHAHLCAGTHDHTDLSMPLLKTPIKIEADAWICADAFVGPGVIVGHGAVVGARAVAVRDIDRFVIAVGNPAVPKSQRVMKRTDYE